MAEKMKPNKAGLALACLVVVWQLIWILMVAIGKQPMLDWILGVHFLADGLRVTSVTFGRAIVSLLIHFVAGYILGWLFATIWNKAK
jgi:ABC-type sulfate transport system permease component